MENKTWYGVRRNSETDRMMVYDRQSIADAYALIRNTEYSDVSALDPAVVVTLVEVKS